MQLPAVHCMYGNVSVYFVMHVELHTLSFFSYELPSSNINATSMPVVVYLVFFVIFYGILVYSRWVDAMY